MTLIGNRVLVKVEEERTWHGIHVPEDITHFENPFGEARIGHVVALGVGRRTKKGVRVAIEGINVGDRVLLPRQDKVRVDYEGKFHWLVNADEVLGKLE